MTADSEKDIEALKAIGRICAETLRKMMSAARPGMTTRELDEIGRSLLDAEGARSAAGSGLQVSRRHLHQRLTGHRARHSQMTMF